jgi:arylsulfatase A-like enzyme
MNGIRSTQGYVSGPYCSPTRTGLVTGRYPTRFAHEFNSATAGERGLSRNETTMADRFKVLGYATCAVGNWHLGHPDAFKPMQRGLDAFYGTLANTRFFHPRALVDSCLSADVRAVSDDAFCTTEAYTARAVDWLERHKNQPWLLYLPFHAQHARLQAPKK